MRCLLILTLVFALASPSLFAQPGKLQRVRAEVRSRPAASCGDEDDDDDGESLLGCFLGGLVEAALERDDDCSDADGCKNNSGKPCTTGGVTLFEDEYPDQPSNGRVFLAAVLFPYSVPFLCAGDSFHHTGYFEPYPFYRRSPGPMWIDRRGDRAGKSWQVRLSIEDGNDFDGLNRLNGRLLLDTSTRFGVQTSWNYFQEDLNPGSDELVLGDVNLVYRFAQCEWMQMRSGVGLRVLDDCCGTDYGFNFTYGADFSAAPFVTSAVLDAGTIGAAGLFHLRGTIGFLLNRFEIYAGYDYFNIGGAELRGPLAGLRLWF